MVRFVRAIALCVKNWLQVTVEFSMNMVVEGTFSPKAWQVAFSITHIFHVFSCAACELPVKTRPHPVVCLLDGRGISV
ncbi:hypothetical protein CSC3H3_12285 [Thalassospira marina]|uniref:Secreted protein n=1 Tax=Thalassospira marina TaxID=2048283 RepID=A0ABN5FFS4_9PROT|nr:hypothetical protein CSC3H3_12285 [Thalassospira marina]